MFRPVIEIGILQDLESRGGSATKGIGRAPYHEGDPCKYDGPRTHDARFFGDIENASLQPPVAQRGSRLRDGDHFGVRRGIVQLLNLIVRLPCKAALMNNHRAYRNFTLGSRSFRLPQSDSHIQGMSL